LAYLTDNESRGIDIESGRGMIPRQKSMGEVTSSGDQQREE